MRRSRCRWFLLFRIIRGWMPAKGRRSDCDDCGTAGEQTGTRGQILQERRSDEEARQIEFRWRNGKLHSNLTVGARTASAGTLEANSEISSPGSNFGIGFHCIQRRSRRPWTRQDRWHRSTHSRVSKWARPDTITAKASWSLTFRLEPDQCENQFPAVYHHVVER